LFRYLAHHPQICASSAKEIGYFTPLYRGRELPPLEEYTRHFSHCRDEKYAMEATPSYCYKVGHLGDALQETLGRPRVIISLRDPVDRLWSAYRFQRTKGHLRGVPSFEKYVKMCIEKHEGLVQRGPFFGGVTIGFYGDYVPAWFDLFGDNVKVIFTDHLFTDPESVVRTLCRWLAIDEDVAGSLDYGVHNKTTEARSVTISAVARAVSKKGDSLLKRAPGVRKNLRKAYLKLNSGPLEEELMPATRLQLEEMYRESNRVVANELKRRGYEGLPPWIDEDAVSPKAAPAAAPETARSPARDSGP
jgi:hypothetical protein